MKTRRRTTTITVGVNDDAVALVINPPSGPTITAWLHPTMARSVAEDLERAADRVAAPRRTTEEGDQ